MKENKKIYLTIKENIAKGLNVVSLSLHKKNYRHLPHINSVNPCLPADRLLKGGQRSVAGKNIGINSFELCII